MRHDVGTSGATTIPSGRGACSSEADSVLTSSFFGSRPSRPLIWRGSICLPSTQQQSSVFAAVAPHSRGRLIPVLRTSGAIDVPRDVGARENHYGLTSLGFLMSMATRHKRKLNKELFFSSFLYSTIFDLLHTRLDGK